MALVNIDKVVDGMGAGGQIYVPVQTLSPEEE